MQTIYYCYLTATIAFIYLAILISKKPYRLLLPSVLSTAAWLITALLLIFQIEGWFVSYKLPAEDVELSSRYILSLTFSSIVGFTIAHLISNIRRQQKNATNIPVGHISHILKRYKWIPYLCFILGSIIFVYLISTIGFFATFGDFRDYAVQANWSGPVLIAKQFSGHVNILGTFYLALIGYKHGQTGINIKEFVLYTMLCSTINLAIGGRLWLITSTLPYFVALIYSTKISIRENKSKKKDTRKLLLIFVIIATTFSLMGLTRDDRDIEKRFIDKFLYFTDGARMSNMVLQRFPPGTFELELGKSEFLGQITPSPMKRKFKDYISHDAGLGVTVQSSIPPLYYDFGYYGGIIMWAVFCLIIEVLSISKIASHSVIGLLFFVQISQMLFLAPIFDIFSVYTPIFEWLLIIYIFRKQLL